MSKFQSLVSSFGALIAKLQYVKHVAVFLGHPVQKYRKFVDENYREPVDGKFADNTERILKRTGAQTLGLERTTMMNT